MTDVTLKLDQSKNEITLSHGKVGKEIVIGVIGKDQVMLDAEEHVRLERDIETAIEE